MPQVVLFRAADGSVPFLDWYRLQVPRLRVRCLVRIERLRDVGHLLRRPEADTLRDGVHELRVSHQGVRVRVPYFFHGRDRAVITHAFVKQTARVPVSEIERTIRMRRAYASNPSEHAHPEEFA